MKEYLKYLIKNPSKLLFSLGVTLFTIILGVSTFIIREDFIIENSLNFFIFSELFFTAILVIGNYQVYKEWKDGVNRKR
jgi:hypothetical protein